MKKLRWLKSYQGSIVGDIFDAGQKSADNFVSQGFAEYVTEPTDTSQLPSNKESKENKIDNTSDIHIDNSSVISVISDIPVISDISVISPNKSLITLITYYTCYSELFSQTLIEQVFLHFLQTNNKPISVAELATKLNVKKESITVKLHLKKELFVNTGVRGKPGVLYLSELGIQEINDRITEYLKEIEERKSYENRQILKQLEARQFNDNLATFMQTIKKERVGNNLILDFNKVSEQDWQIANYILEKPQDFFDGLKEIYEQKYHITVCNLPDSLSVNIENIRKEHSNRLITVEGRLTSFGEVRPVSKVIKYECPSCGTVISIAQDYLDGRIKEPSRCSCSRKGGFRVLSKIDENSSFLQLEDLQDKTDNPHSQRIKAIIFNRLCDVERIKMFSPGNEIKVHGILKEVKKDKKSLFSSWILEVLDAELIEKDINMETLSDEDIVKIKEVSKDIDENGLIKLTNSFAPEVHGYNVIKNALIFQLCNRRNDRKNKSVRNKSNILLIGDPGVAKSILCNFSIEITNGSRKAVGGGSSAVGITASVVKEEESMGGYRVEPGAMVLAKELLFIDEMNNLSDEDKPKLQEGMNEQTISINKANLHVQMKVTCGIIAACNPKNGTFTDTGYGKIEEQFNIPTPILNRFDNVFVVRDVIDKENDKHIAKKMLQRYSGRIVPLYDKEFLKKFFSYIRFSSEPTITKDIEDKLQEVYSFARNNNDGSVKINPRFLESLTRLCSSSAKLRQSDVIELKDIVNALEILQESQYKIHKSIIQYAQK